MNLGPDYEEQIIKAVDIVQQEDPDTVTLSSGVVLRYLPVPLLRIQSIVNKFSYPPVPELWDEKREQSIKNPNHPAYLEERDQVDLKRTNAVLDAIIAFGMEIVSTPETLPKIEDSGWIEECKDFFFIDINPQSERSRKLAWIKFVAIVDQNDFRLISKAFNLSLGVSESRVAEAMRDRFPDNPVRNTAS